MGVGVGVPPIAGTPFFLFSLGGVFGTALTHSPCPFMTSIPTFMTFSAASVLPLPLVSSTPSCSCSAAGFLFGGGGGEKTVIRMKPNDFRSPHPLLLPLPLLVAPATAAPGPFTHPNRALGWGWCSDPELDTVA